MDVYGDAILNDINIYNSETDVHIMKKINIYTVNSLTRYNDIVSDFLIVDEAHLYRTQYAVRLLYESKYKHLIGLSATPYTGM